jgi:predicted MFS family arabinose efflux permease
METDLIPEDETPPAPDPQTDPPSPPKEELTLLRLIVFAIGAGLTVANLYYTQPLLSYVMDYFEIDETRAGLLTTFTQIGYALGMLFIVPLADIIEKRKLVLIMLVLIIVVLVGVCASPVYEVTLIACLLLGLTSVTPQIFVPVSAQLAGPERRGKVVGIVLSGLMIGILVSRVLSGALADWLGWKTVFGAAAVLTLFLLIAVVFIMPRLEPLSDLKYFQIIKSLWSVFCKFGDLRYAATCGMCVFSSFSVFWTCLSYLLDDHYGWGPAIAGLFGLVGVVGALAAQVGGRIVDKYGTFVMVSGSIILALVSYICVATVCWWLAGLIITIIGIDAGIQGCNTALQTLIQSLSDEERARITALYIFMYFVGGSIGSATGAALYQHYGWVAVGLLGICFISTGAAVHFITQTPKKCTPPPDEPEAQPIP